MNAHVVSTVELLEVRIAPANAVLLTATNTLQIYDTDTPGAASAAVPILGLVPGDIMAGIDFRPSTGDLYGLGVNGAVAHLYRIDETSGVAILIGGNIALPQSAGLATAGTQFGFDFNPVADAIRVVANNRDNFRLSPNTGAVLGADTALNPGTPTITGAAYTNSFFGTTSTTLFDIDSNTDQLFVQGGNPVPPGTSPNLGTLTLVGPLGFDAGGELGFDIAPDGSALAALQVGGISGLYTVSLTTGTATLVANFAGGTTVRDLAIAPPSVTVAANGKTATYIDSDGDTVTIKTTRGTFEPSDFQLIATSATGNAQLTRISLGDDGTEFQGANLTVSVTKKKGDGFANVGFVDATGVDLGKVTINGDLGRIVAGDATLTTAGVKALKLRSMGSFGGLTQGGVSSLESNIEGVVGQLVIQRDFIDAVLTINGEDGLISKISIGGDVVGGVAIESGRIEAEGAIGSLLVRGRIIGGSGEDSGVVRCFDDIATATLGGIVGGAGDDSGFFEGSARKLVIKGSMIGGSGAESGSLESEGDTGTITIKGTVQGGAGLQSGRLDLDEFIKLTVGSIVGGAGDDSGQIDAEDGDVAVRGSIFGGAGSGSGSVRSGTDLGSVTVGGSVVGGGTGAGRISAGARLGAVTIAGDLIGGGVDGGSISAATIESIRIGGDFTGGNSGNAEGRIFVPGSLNPEVIPGDVGSIFIGGNLVGGAFESGRIEIAGELGDFTVRGSIIGSEGSISGTVRAAEIAKVTIGRDLRGGDGGGSGAINADTIGTVKIGRSILGGGGDESGAITALTIGPVSVGGDVDGGGGERSGIVNSFFSIGDVRIKGSLHGGGAQGSGQLVAGGNIGTVQIGGNVIGSSFADTGKIVGIRVGHVTIGGNLIGGSFASAVPRADSGVISAGTLDGVTIGGSLIAGANDPSVPVAGVSGGILAQTLGPVVIGGDILGSVTNRALIVTTGQQEKPASGTDFALASLTVKGDVQFADILAGFNIFDRTPLNADASVGPVTVGGDWRASNLVAGAEDTGAPGFGNGDSLQTADNTSLIARIAKITIGGDVLGTGLTIGDHFGFVAEQIDALTIAGRKIKLTTGPNNDQLISIGSGNDVKLDEVGS
jgi:hypothetical protein